MEDSQVIKSTVNSIGNQSPYLQIAVGAGSGFVTGFALLKAFKVLSILLGGAILTIELAVQSEIITIRWDTILFHLDADTAEEERQAAQRQRQDPRALPDPFKKIKKALLNSARFSVAFIGGFLLGMGFS